MHFTCSQKGLINALSIVSKAVATNSTLPVLNNVFVKVEGKKVYLTATNLELAIHYWIEAEVKNEGEITIPAKLLTSYVGFLKDDQVEVKIDDGQQIVVKSGRSNTKIKGVSSDEFPSIPKVDKEGGFSIKIKDFSEAINQVVFASALNTTRPILTGVYCYMEDGKIRMVATDSYRLAEKTIEINDLQGEISCVIPAKTLMEVGAVIGMVSGVDKIEVVTSKNQIMFIIGNIQITSRLIEGQFPNYRQVIPTDCSTKVILKSSELALTLKRINLFAKENNNKVLIRVNGGELDITTEVTQFGVGEERMAVLVEGEGEGEIALNSQFMLDLLSNMKADEVILKLNDKTKPAVFSSVDQEGYIHIIMPLKM